VIDGSRHVVCERCFFSGTADALTIQSSDRPGAQPAEDITVRETVLYAGGIGLAVGPGNTAAVRGIRAEGVDIARAVRGINVIQSRGAGMSDLVFRNVRMRLIATAEDARSGSALGITSYAITPTTGLHDVLFEGIDANVCRTSNLVGSPYAPIVGLRIEGMRILAESVRPSYNQRAQEPLLRCGHVRNSRIRGLDVTWPQHRDELWGPELESRWVDNLDFQPPGTGSRPATGSAPAE
jgi:hypothetical protein